MQNQYNIKLSYLKCPEFVVSGCGRLEGQRSREAISFVSGLFTLQKTATKIDIIYFLVF